MDSKRLRCPKFLKIFEKKFWFTKSLIGNAPDDAILLRLADIAKATFQSDLNGDGEVNGDDLVAFNPLDGSHLDALKFKYQPLLHTDVDGTTLLTAYRDHRTTKKQLTLTLFGEGQILNHEGEVELQYPDSGKNTVKKWLEKDQAFRRLWLLKIMNFSIGRAVLWCQMIIGNVRYDSHLIALSVRHWESRHQKSSYC